MGFRCPVCVADFGQDKSAWHEHIASKHQGAGLDILNLVTVWSNACRQAKAAQPKTPGRLRTAAAQILTENGFPCTPDDIHVAVGWYRSNVQADVYRWTVLGHGSWQTLTSFVKNAQAGNPVIINKGSDEIWCGESLSCSTN